MMKRKILTSLFLFLITGLTQLWADSVRISQIDNYKLLLNQEIKLYLSVTDKVGKPLEKLNRKNFSLLESSDGKNYKKIEQIKGFQTGSNYEKGVSFLLLLDNSGSMYQNLEGKKARNKKEQRISYAKQAILNFLKSSNNPKDRFGLIAYNSFYQRHAGADGRKIDLIEHLKQVKMPTRKDAFASEIYGSLKKSAEEFKTVRGRKALIILTDGENFSYLKKYKKSHPDFGDKKISWTAPLKELEKEGVSVYAIYFGVKAGKKDKYLTKIAQRTGGATFDANDPEELNQVYLKIMDQILKEYIVSYKATMEPAEKKYVKVVYNQDNKKATAKRSYLSSTVFGIPEKTFNPLIALAFVSGILILWLLSKLKFEKQRPVANLEVLQAGTGSVSTKVLDLTLAKTVIGSSTNADITIAGVAAVQENHATVVFDETTQKHTLVGQGNLMVNNKFVKTKILEPGDLINIDGTTMVFDTGETVVEKTEINDSKS